MALLLAALSPAHAAWADDTRGPQGEPSEVAKKLAERMREIEEEQGDEVAREALIIAATRTPRKEDCPSIEHSPGFLEHWGRLSGRKPYNCLTWAFCKKDGWRQPVGQPGTPEVVGGTPKTLAQLLADEGFSEVDCSTSTAAHMIMLVWFIDEVAGPPNPNPPTPPDGAWIHALKRLNGNWSSKNGEGALYKGIPNTDEFLDRYYPAPPGKTRVTKCYAKP